VTNNLSALGVGHVHAVTVVGPDGEGFELKRELAARRVDLTHVIDSSQCHTPTYTKPMLDDGTKLVREWNRLDIKNRRAMPAVVIEDVIRRLEQVVAQSDAVIVADQVSEAECGVITSGVRRRLAELSNLYPQTILFADSRERIGLFSGVIVKPNRAECIHAAGRPRSCTVDRSAIDAAARVLARHTGRAVYCTLGDQGILYVDAVRLVHVPSYPVSGSIDIVGAGDSTTAGIVCALCAGADPIDAAALGNLVASITIQQIGTTGIATPEQVLARWHEVAAG
jgi:sugar/nucleoside kinase (ribokinase family)